MLTVKWQRASDEKPQTKDIKIHTEAVEFCESLHRIGNRYKLLPGIHRSEDLRSPKRNKRRRN